MAVESEVPRHRLDALTDGVVAIAATLLVLPLVELAPELGDRPVLELLGQHLDVLLSFAVSFVVIIAFWLVHARSLAALDDPGAAVRGVTVLWLAAVAFLPFPTALIGRGPTAGSVPFYVGTLALIGTASAAIRQLAWRRMGSPPGSGRRQVVVGWVIVGVFVACAALGAVAPDAALFALLVLVPVRLAARR